MDFLPKPIVDIIELFSQKLPIGDLVEYLVEFSNRHVGFFTKAIANTTGEFIVGFKDLLLLLPPLVFIFLFALLAWRLSKLSLAIFTAIGLLLILNLGLWEATIETLSMVITATLISIFLGLPIGILAALNPYTHKVTMPLLDFMQTMPAFVYLIPAITFFGLGAVPAVMATVVFSMPPAIRLTSLGIKQVPAELMEASEAFGSTTFQKLIKIQLPLAMPTIMAGINQCIMLSLSMVVIAAMIGAKGLGGEVWRAIQRLDIGMGFEGGLGVVILAIILDRLTQNLGRKNNNR